MTSYRALAVAGFVISASLAPPAAADLIQPPQPVPVPTPEAPAPAAETAPAQQAADEAAQQAAFLQALGYKKGPLVGDMGIAQINVPAGMVFTDGAGAKKWAEMTTNPVSGKELGLIGPEDQSWLVMFEFDDVGYVKDDEKDDLEADELIQSIKEGTESFNETRRQQGASELHVLGWEQKPAYNESLHALEWCVRMEANGEPSLNFNTRVLGRKGVMIVTLMFGGETKLSDVLPKFREVMKGFSYKSGETYAEYRSGDHLAEYGLGALVAGGAVAAAAKSGLLGKLGLLIAKAGKLIVLAIAGVGAAIGKLWSRITGKGTSSSNGGDGA